MVMGAVVVVIEQGPMGRAVCQRCRNSAEDEKKGRRVCSELNAATVVIDRRTGQTSAGEWWCGDDVGESGLARRIRCV